jgi:hypothetical protein
VDIGLRTTGLNCLADIANGVAKDRLALHLEFADASAL